MSKNYHIAVLPGDGIGPEVMTQALLISHFSAPMTPV